MAVVVVHAQAIARVLSAGSKMRGHAKRAGGVEPQRNGVTSDAVRQEARRKLQVVNRSPQQHPEGGFLGSCVSARRTARTCMLLCCCSGGVALLMVLTRITMTATLSSIRKSVHVTQRPAVTAHWCSWSDYDGCRSYTPGVAAATPRSQGQTVDFAGKSVPTAWPGHRFTSSTIELTLADCYFESLR